MSKQAKIKNNFLKQKNSKEKDDDDEAEITETAADDAVPPAEKKKKCRPFRADWKDRYPWLRCEVIDGTEKMFCSQCEKSGKKNGFTRGSTNMRCSSLIEHSQCNDHVMAVSLFSQQIAMKGHCEKATKTLNKTLCSQLQVVFHMTKNDIACHQYEGLTELLGAVRAPDFVTREGIYRHSDSVDDMEKVHFGTAQCIFNKLVEVLRERDVELSRAISLGSDGAIVMMGKRAGVGALLRREESILHSGALCCTPSGTGRARCCKICGPDRGLQAHSCLCVLLLQALSTQALITDY